MVKNLLKRWVTNSFATNLPNVQLNRCVHFSTIQSELATIDYFLFLSTSPLLCANSLFGKLFSNTRNILSSSVMARYQVSHSQKKTEKIIAFRIVILGFQRCVCPLSTRQGASSGCGWRRRPPHMEVSWEYTE
jgi:hypothetical protein